MSNILHDHHTPTPPFLGKKSISISSRELFPFLNEPVLLKGRWKFTKGELVEEEYNKLIANKAKPILENWKEKILNENLIEPKATYGYFPCNANENILEIYNPVNSTEKIASFNFPRQADNGKLSVADFFKPKNLGVKDLIAMQVVTVGHKAGIFATQLYDDHKYSDYFYFHGLSSQLTEAFADYLHNLVRKELRIPSNQGIRYSFGYGACPNLEENRKLLNCLEAESIGVIQNEAEQMVPEQSTSAIIVWHPEARHFTV